MDSGCTVKLCEAWDVERSPDSPDPRGTRRFEADGLRLAWFFDPWHPPWIDPADHWPEALEMVMPDMFRRQTWVAKPGEVKKVWREIDAEGVPLGRLAAEVALVLMGKHRPEYTPHTDCGDYVVVKNAQKVELKGNKAEYRMKQRYTSYPGGLKMESYGQVRDSKPELLVEDAVRRMLPKNRLSRVMMKGLMVYPGAEHPHTNQKMETLKVK